MFSTDIFYVLNGLYQTLARITLLLSNWISLKRAVSCIGALFASNDSKTSFEQRKNAR
jgi:hypothetical protein